MARREFDSGILQRRRHRVLLCELDVSVAAGRVVVASHAQKHHLSDRPREKLFQLIAFALGRDVANVDGAPDLLQFQGVGVGRQVRIGR